MVRLKTPEKNGQCKCPAVFEAPSSVLALTIADDANDARGPRQTRTGRGSSFDARGDPRAMRDAGAASAEIEHQLFQRSR
jgi:hypothetical protein